MAKTQMRPWDPIRGLDTAEEIVGYVDAVLALDDLQLFEVVLKDIGRAVERYKIQKEDIIRVVEHVAIESEKVQKHKDRIACVGCKGILNVVSS